MTPLETVLDAIYRQTGKRPTGTGPYYARCPAHHDRHPSLVISQGGRTEGDWPMPTDEDFEKVAEEAKPILDTAEHAKAYLKGVVDKGPH